MCFQRWRPCLQLKGTGRSCWPYTSPSSITAFTWSINKGSQSSSGASVTFQATIEVILVFSPAVVWLVLYPAGSDGDVGRADCMDRQVSVRPQGLWSSPKTYLEEEEKKKKKPMCMLLSSLHWPEPMARYLRIIAEIAYYFSCSYSHPGTWF